MIDFDNKELAGKQIGELLFDRLNEIDIVIIKCHLLTEYSLNYYIETKSNNREPIHKSRFSFSNKIKIAKLFGLFDSLNSKELETFINDINSLRNQVAHNLEYDPKLLEKLVEYPKDYKPEKWTSKEMYFKGILSVKTSFYVAKICGLAKPSVQNNHDTPTEK
jgi:hypothetical protein